MGAQLNLPVCKKIGGFSLSSVARRGSIIMLKPVTIIVEALF